MKTSSCHQANLLKQSVGDGEYQNKWRWELNWGMEYLRWNPHLETLSKMFLKFKSCAVSSSFPFLIWTAIDPVSVIDLCTQTFVCRSRLWTATHKSSSCSCVRWIRGKDIFIYRLITRQTPRGETHRDNNFGFFSGKIKGRPGQWAYTLISHGLFDNGSRGRRNSEKFTEKSWNNPSANNKNKLFSWQTVRFCLIVQQLFSTCSLCCCL